MMAIFVGLAPPAGWRRLGDSGELRCPLISRFISLEAVLSAESLACATPFTSKRARAGQRLATDADDH